MDEQKANNFQYERLSPQTSPSPEPNQLPTTPPPYSPYPEYPDQYSHVLNRPNSGGNGDPQPIYVQPMPGFTPINTNPDYYHSNYGTIVQTVPQTVIFIGSCPACRVGILEEDFTCLGILLAILFFPLGIICCLALRQRRCPNCGTSFD